MKAFKLTDICKMEMMEVPTPEIANDTDVLIAMKAIGVCGSDVHYYDKGRIGNQIVEYPFTVGHEGAGQVVKVGAAVTKVSVGDRIAIDPADPCGKCDQCLNNRPHTCRNLTYLGCPGQAEGCLSEYIVMPEQSCLPLPENVSFEEGALSEPLSIGLYSVIKAELPANPTIGILGTGPIGLSVLLSATAKGVKNIYVTDKIVRRLQLAEKAGGIIGGNPDKTNIVETILAKSPEGLDTVFECCGEQDALDQAIELLKPGGTLVIIGIPAVTEKIYFNVDSCRRKEIRIQNIRRQNECAQAAIDMIAEKEVDVNIMTTHRFSFQETQAAFEMVKNYADGVVKAMISIP